MGWTKAFLDRAKCRLKVSKLRKGKGSRRCPIISEQFPFYNSAAKNNPTVKGSYTKYFKYQLNFLLFFMNLYYLLDT